VTDEHEHAMKVAEQAYSAGNLVTCDGYYEFDLDAAAAVIAADRAGLVAEVERLVRAWEEQHKEKVKERGESRLWFEKAQKWAEENARRYVAAAMLGWAAYGLAIGAGVPAWVDWPSEAAPADAADIAVLVGCAVLLLTRKGSPHAHD
jgi:hypothetical protein